MVKRRRKYAGSAAAGRKFYFHRDIYVQSYGKSDSFSYFELYRYNAFLYDRRVCKNGICGMDLKHYGGTGIL